MAIAQADDALIAEQQQAPGKGRAQFLFLIRQAFRARSRGQLAALPFSPKPTFPALRHAPSSLADGNPVVGIVTAFQTEETCPARPVS
jgi:hypothetical protein